MTASITDTPFQTGETVRDLRDRCGEIIEIIRDVAVVDFGDSVEATATTDLRVIKQADGRYSFSELRGVAEPTSYDLRKIAKFQPSGLPPVEATDGIVISFVAADNMVDRSMKRWPVESLKQSVKLLGGQPLTLDHDVETVSKVQALIFDAGIAEIPEPSRHLIDTSYNTKQNRDIASREGYVALVVRAFAPVDSKLVDGLRFGMGQVSLGYMYGDMHCPVCSTSFYNEACPHYAPLHLEDRNDKGVAPWIDKVQPYEFYELSVVTESNLPRATVIRNLHSS